MRRDRVGNIQSRSLRRAGVAFVVLGTLGVSCAASADTPLTVDYISIAQSADGTTGNECYASKAGTSVVVKDGSGDILGTGRAGVGLWEAHPDGRNHDCVHRTTIELGDADHYVLSIEGLGGELTYSKDKLGAADWSIAIG